MADLPLIARGLLWGSRPCVDWLEIIVGKKTLVVFRAAGRPANRSGAALRTGSFGFQCNSAHTPHLLSGVWEVFPPVPSVGLCAAVNIVCVVSLKTLVRTAETPLRSPGIAVAHHSPSPPDGSGAVACGVHARVLLQGGRKARPRTRIAVDALNTLKTSLNVRLGCNSCLGWDSALENA